MKWVKSLVNFFIQWKLKMASLKEKTRMKKNDVRKMEAKNKNLELKIELYKAKTERGKLIGKFPREKDRSEKKDKSEKNSSQRKCP